MNSDKYIISPAIIRFVERLIKEGYQGEALINNKYPSGIAGELNDNFSISISGFCKETLYLTSESDTGVIHAFGRYKHQATWDAAEVEVIDIVKIALSMADKYVEHGYKRYKKPPEFHKLFAKYEQTLASEKLDREFDTHLPDGKPKAIKSRL